MWRVKFFITNKSQEVIQIKTTQANSLRFRIQKGVSDRGRFVSLTK